MENPTAITLVNPLSNVQLEKLFHTRSLWSASFDPFWEVAVAVATGQPIPIKDNNWMLNAVTMLRESGINVRFYENFGYEIEEVRFRDIERDEPNYIKVRDGEIHFYFI